jgi:hypothetical protein
MMNAANFIKLVLSVLAINIILFYSLSGSTVSYSSNDSKYKKFRILEFEIFVYR